MRANSMENDEGVMISTDNHDWQGSRQDRVLYDLLTVKEYTLATSVASVRPYNISSSNISSSNISSSTPQPSLRPECFGTDLCALPAAAALTRTLALALASFVFAQTASRFGSEVPALARMLISHGHMREWCEELLDKEMATVSPLGLLQAESASMLLWMVTTEVAGCPFLARVLGPTVGEICRSDRVLEMDPQRADPSMISANASKLLNIVNTIIDALNHNIDHFPLCCSQILYAVENAVANTFGLMAHTTVSRYLYHRFFLEAILAPAAVGITDAQPNDNALHNLALVHQIMEKLCTIDGVFERNNQQAPCPPLSPDTPPARHPDKNSPPCCPWLTHYGLLSLP